MSRLLEALEVRGLRRLAREFNVSAPLGTPAPRLRGLLRSLPQLELTEALQLLTDDELARVCKRFDIVGVSGRGPIVRRLRATLSWRPFDEARQLVHTLSLSRVADWRAYCRGELTDGQVAESCWRLRSPRSSAGDEL